MTMIVEILSNPKIFLFRLDPIFGLTRRKSSLIFERALGEDDFRIAKLMRCYFKVGAYHTEIFEEYENRLLRSIARNYFRRNLENIHAIEFKFNDIEFKMAKMKPVSLAGNLATYTNKNSHLHDPNQNLFDPLITDAIVKKKNKGGLFFDLGAHAGIYSIFACAQGYEVVSVEIHPDMIPVIRINRKINKFQKLHIVNKAVDKEAGKALMMHVDPRVGSKIHLTKHQDDFDSYISIPKVSLDDLAALYGTPSIVKIDIEGNEINALDGAKDTIAKMNTCFLIDVHSEYILRCGYPRDIFATYFPMENWKTSILDSRKLVEINPDRALDHKCIKLTPRE